MAKRNKNDFYAAYCFRTKRYNKMDGTEVSYYTSIMEYEWSSWLISHGLGR